MKPVRSHKIIESMVIIMINEYLYDSKDGNVVAFNTEDELKHFLRKRLRFGWWSKLASYTVVLGFPMGKAKHTDHDELTPLYKIYGVAGQAEDGTLLGRKVPSTLVYRLPLIDFEATYGLALHFAATNDIQSSTKTLLAAIKDDQRLDIKGALINDREKRIVLTSVLPLMMTDDVLEKVAE